MAISMGLDSGQNKVASLFPTDLLEMFPASRTTTFVTYKR